MKRFSRKSFLLWFGYTRRERRASFILLILIFIVTGFRYIIPYKPLRIEEVPVKDTVILYEEEKQTVNPRYNYYNGPGNMQDEPIELNTCDSASLEALPGIGPVLSARIIKFRKLLGGFAGKEQLREVYGLSGEVYDLISPRVCVDTTVIGKIAVNNAAYRDFIRLPYFENYEVNAILKYRQLQGRINNISDMIINNLISGEKARKVRPYLDFGE